MVLCKMQNKQILPCFALWNSSLKAAKLELGIAWGFNSVLLRKVCKKRLKWQNFRTFPQKIDISKHYVNISQLFTQPSKLSFAIAVLAVAEGSYWVQSCSALSPGPWGGGRVSAISFPESNLVSTHSLRWSWVDNTQHWSGSRTPFCRTRNVNFDREKIS